ncbi:MAG: PRC-barrel domain-containing protein [Thermodesulfovibrionia bacterium]|nr:PRC-barrel domain-containing protein [Thermodesulfovibrionia bacterium]
MKKLTSIIAMNIIALVLVVTGAFAADMMNDRSATTQWASNLIGTTVKNLQGETLGTITDLTISNNIVTFAVITHGGALAIGDKLIPVPMNALKITDNKNATLDASKEKLATAPNYEKNSKQWPDFSNRKYAEDTYRFYGVELYWEASDMEHMMEKEAK